MKRLIPLLLLLALPRMVFGAVTFDAVATSARTAASNTGAVTFPSQTAGDVGFITCATTATGGTWTTPSGWSVVPNTTQLASNPSAILYEKNIVAGDLGASETCSYSVSGNVTAGAIDYMGARGVEATDVNATQRNANSTTGTTPGATATLSNDLMLSVITIAANGSTISAPSAGTQRGTGTSGVGWIDQQLASTTAPSITATIGTSSSSEGTTVTIAPGTPAGSAMAGPSKLAGPGNLD